MGFSVVVVKPVKPGLSDLGPSHGPKAYNMGTCICNSHSASKQSDPVVRRVDNTVHRINRYPVDKC